MDEDMACPSCGHYYTYRCHTCGYPWDEQDPRP